MKKLLLILTLLFLITPFKVFSQTLTFKDVQNKECGGLKVDKIDTYIASSNDTFSLNKIITLGSSDGKTFTYVMWGGVNYGLMVDAKFANTKAVIKNIKIAGTKNTGCTVLVTAKGQVGSISPLLIWIESAINQGEIITTFKGKEELLKELKMLKDEFDLNIITEEEYNNKSKPIKDKIKTLNN